MWDYYSYTYYRIAWWAWIITYVLTRKQNFEKVFHFQKLTCQWKSCDSKIVILGSNPPLKQLGLHNDRHFIFQEFQEIQKIFFRFPRRQFFKDMYIPTQFLWSAIFAMLLILNAHKWRRLSARLSHASHFSMINFYSDKNAYVNGPLQSTQALSLWES